MARLGDICTIQSGGTPARGNKEYWDNGDIPWVKISDFSGKYLEKTSEKITKAGLCNSSAKIFPKGTVLYTIFATLGETCILDIDAATNQAIAGLSLTDDSVALDYLYYYLLSKKEYVNEIGRGVAQNNINMKILREMEILIPSMEEQKRVTETLNKVYELISLRREQLAKLDRLVKSRFIELFGDPVQNPFKWDTKPLLEMGYCKNGMNFHTGDSGIEMHCLGVGDFKDYSVIDGTDHLPTISLNETPPAESMLQNGDIVFVRSNGNKALVGRCLVVYPHDTPTTYSGFCIRYRLTSDEVKTAYLLRVLKTESIRKKMAGRGANIQNLNQQILASLDIPIPPMEIQEQFTSFVKQTDKSKLVIQQSLNKLELLKKSLMQKYFG